MLLVGWEMFPIGSDIYTLVPQLMVWGSYETFSMGTSRAEIHLRGGVGWGGVVYYSLASISFA